MLAVRGGVAGIRFQLEELELGAAEFDRLVEDLHAFEYEERAIWDQLGISERSLHMYEARVSCDAALDAIQASWQSVALVRERLQRMAADIRASCRDYEAAEAWPGLGLSPALAGVPWLESSGGSSAGLLSTRGSVESLTQGLAFVLGFARGPAQAALSTVALVGASKGAGPRNVMVQRAVRTIVESEIGKNLRPRPVAVQWCRTTVEDVDASPAGLLRRVEQLGETGEGEIEVVRLDNPGRTSWAVLLPGTQTTVPTGGSNPFDEAGVADAMGYGSENTAAAIRQALHEAGVEAGEQIAIVGYSQGGIHAMNLAQDRAFLADFDVRFVLTAGSPVGGATAEPGIASLHLEHEHDVVPGMDGLPNPDAKDRVTVTLSNPLSLGPMDEVGLGPGHKLPIYLEGAEAVAASGHPSLVASTAALAAVTGAGGASGVTRIRLERAPNPAPSASVRQGSDQPRRK
jgi:pimeloyl-ACP methyl ester carboxylesterase